MSEDLVGSLLAGVKQLRDRVDELETTVAEQRDRIDTLEARTDRLETENDRLQQTLDTITETVVPEAVDAHLETVVDEQVEQQVEESITEHTDKLWAFSKALGRKAKATRNQVQELQARELEKGAHLEADNVTPSELPTSDVAIELITKDGGRYYRVTDSADPLSRGGSVRLATEDLLPIQQLARMDDEMLRSATSSQPARLAAKLWKARSDPTVGDNPWQQGSRNVRESVQASELRHWIRRQDPGISHDYAQKLVSRVIETIQELSHHRLTVHTQQQRKNGLQYTERRLVLPADADIPGDPTEDDGSPATADVVG